MEAKDRNLTHERRRLLATVNEMMAAHNYSGTNASRSTDNLRYRDNKARGVGPYYGDWCCRADQWEHPASHRGLGLARFARSPIRLQCTRLPQLPLYNHRLERTGCHSISSRSFFFHWFCCHHRLSLHHFSILFSSIDFAATIKLNYIVLKNLLKSYLGKMTGELSKGYLARVNLQEKGLESAEIILQVTQINPLGNGKYGLIVHDCQNQMKALLNSSMSGLVRGESLIDGTTRTWGAPAVRDAG